MMRAVIGYTLLVMLVLLILNGLYLLITEQDDIGTGTYTTAMRFMFVGAQPAADTHSTCCRSPR